MPEELLYVVDANNQPLEPATMSEVYEKCLHHRVVHIFLMNDQHEILMQQRSATKSFKPLAWMHTAGGHVRAGEDVAAAGARELEEEMGIITPLQEIITDVFEGRGMKKFFTVFLGTIPTDQPIHLDPIEVATWQWIPINTLADFMCEHDYLEESRFVLQIALDRGLL